MNKDLESHIMDLCQKTIIDKGWKTFQDIEVEVAEQLHPVNAAITTADRKIHIEVCNDFYKAVETLKTDEKLEEDSGSITELIVQEVVEHEYSHHGLCPRTKENFEQILDGIFEAIHGKEYDTGRIRELCFYISNAFSDTIVNTTNAHTGRDKESYRKGFDMLYLFSENYQRKKVGKRHTSKGFTLFVDTNQFLCGTSKELNEKMWKKYFPSLFIGFSRYRKKIIDVFTGDENLTNLVLKRQLDEESATKLVDRLKDTSLWNQMAYDYAKIMHPFLNKLNDGEAKLLENSFTKGSGSPSSKKQPKESQQPKQGDKDQKTPGDKKDDKCSGKDKGDLIDDLIRRLTKDHTPYTSPYLQDFAKLDQLYRLRAGKLALYAQDKNISPQYEKNLSREELPLDDFKASDIDWASTRVIRKKDGSKHVELYRGSVPLILPFEGDEKPVGLPDLSFIFDSSISMGFQPYSGDGNGEYHFAALTFYSILNYLESEGIAPLLNYHLINFSNSTYSSGWCSYSEINKVKVTLFDYQSGGTVLNPKYLHDLRTSRKDNVISFMLSDTDFNLQENEKEIIKAVDEILASGGIGFYLFQMGQPSTFSEEMKKRNVPVHYVKSAEDFMNKAIRFSKDLYGEAIAK
ncbi:MAG: hypothetical protein Q8N77_02170 [Nanoarchaeota archaeon]|nr:hypothetical protein [Nanoarchaeota archaeon]